MSDYGSAPDAPLDEIEWRVNSDIDSGGGVRVVAYVEGHVVARLLDGWVGPFNWRDHYELTGKQGTLWCHLSVRENGEWVTKEDIGTASSEEPDKGLVSDAFKRVATRKWGVARNVYDLPILRLPRGKFRTYTSHGKERAALNEDSVDFIAQELQRRGYSDAAEATRVATDDPDKQVADEEREAYTPAPAEDYETIPLDYVKGLLADTRELGVEDEQVWKKLRGFARAMTLPVPQSWDQIHTELREPLDQWVGEIEGAEDSAEEAPF